MPPFILDKYRRGIISNAHFSDLLRTLLLINYGGVWVDATVLLTKEIPKIILDSDFFVFINSNGISPCSNWFIVARKGSPLLKRVFEVLAEYWQDNKYLINYFIYHICVRLVITYDEEAKQIWENMFPKNNTDPHFLQGKLCDNMDIRMKDYLWDLSFAHKLTYKFKYFFGDESLPDKKDTFYQYIISENLTKNG
jgi:mannosyltransferase OCH1-like enzyme